MTSAMDRHLIMDALARYAWGYDTADFDMLGAVFTEDAVSGGIVTGTDIAWGPMHGRAEIVSTLAGMRRQQAEQRRHNVGSFLFEAQTPTTATVRYYLTLVSTRDGKSRLVTGGTYSADLIKENDVWRIRRLEAVLDAPF